MYMSVRKPPLFTKTPGKSNGLRREDVGVVDQQTRGRMPSVPKTSSFHAYSRNCNNNFLTINKQRGGKSNCQTTSLFEGGIMRDELCLENENNDDNKNGGVTGQFQENVVLPNDVGQCNSYGRGSVGMHSHTKYNLRRNVSDNVAAVLGGSTLTTGYRLGNGVTRKAFSGPSSSRLPTSQQGGGGGGSGSGSGGAQHRLQPPGSGGLKVGARHNQFVLNVNSNQPMPPLLPRNSLSLSQRQGSLDTSSVSLRHIKERTQESGGQFDSTHNFDGLSTKFGLEPNSGNAQWEGNVSPSFSLASVKLQQVATPSRPPSAGMVLDTSTGIPLSCRGSSLGGLANSVKLPGAVVEECPGKVNTLQYDFRVVASTSKTFNSPIKLTVGMGCLQGLRPTMEDEHFVRLNAATATGQTVSLLGILDGHCGRRVAELAAKYVPDNFVAHSAVGENNALAFVESIIQADRAIFHAIGKGTTSGSVGSRNGSGGSTLIAAAVHGRMLYVACLGDARAVLYDGYKTIPMSEDHKPNSKKEHTRILQCGGFVHFGRVCGILAVSRALGDFEFKFNGNRFLVNRELMVSNVADVRQINLTDSSKFLLMACDGLWDVVENEEATQFVRDFLSYTPDVGLSPDATQRALNNCCQKLAEFAVDRGSTDNVSVMLLFFHDVAEVVAGFDRLGGGFTSPTAQNSSPRISFPKRGLGRGSSSSLLGCAGRSVW